MSSVVKNMWARALKVAMFSDLHATRFTLGFAELLWAITLLWPGDTFGRPTYTIMAKMWSEETWGVIFLLSSITQFSILMSMRYHDRFSVIFAGWNAALWIFVVLSMRSNGWHESWWNRASDYRIKGFVGSERMGETGTVQKVAEALDLAGLTIFGTAAVGIVLFAGKKFIVSIFQDSTSTKAEAVAAEATSFNYQQLREEIERLNKLVREMDKEIKRLRKEQDELRDEIHSGNSKLSKAGNYALLSAQAIRLLCTCEDHIKSEMLVPLNDIIDLAEGNDHEESKPTEEV